MNERLVRLTKIGDHLPIKVFPMPPYRDQLSIKLDALTSVLRTANISYFHIQIGFHPITTSVDLYPAGNWQWRPDVQEHGLQELLVYLDTNGNLVWKFPYRDSETRSAGETARLASRFVRDAVGKSVMTLPVFGSVIDRITERVLPAVFYASYKPFISDLVVEQQ